MTDQARVRNSTYNSLPTDIEEADSLAKLALDMRWSWNHATGEIWRRDRVAVPLQAALILWQRRMRLEPDRNLERRKRLATAEDTKPLTYNQHGGVEWDRTGKAASWIRY